MECFSTAYLFLHGVTDTCSFLDAPFFTAKVFLGGIYNYETPTHCWTVTVIVYLILNIIIISIAKYITYNLLWMYRRKPLSLQVQIQIAGQRFIYTAG